MRCKSSKNDNHDKCTRDSTAHCITAKKRELFHPMSYPSCSNVLYLLLKSVRRQPEDVAFAKLVNLVLAHAASPLDRVRTRALEYLEVFVLQAPSTMIPHVGSILAVVLPNHALDETDRIKMSEEEYRGQYRCTIQYLHCTNDS